MSDNTKLKEEIKELMVKACSIDGLKASQIKDDDRLFGEGLGLDSLDAVEIVVMLQRNYGINLRNTENAKKAFQSINTLTEFVEHNRSKN